MCTTIPSLPGSSTAGGLALRRRAVDDVYTPFHMSCASGLEPTSALLLPVKCTVRSLRPDRRSSVGAAGIFRWGGRRKR